MRNLLLRKYQNIFVSHRKVISHRKWYKVSSFGRFYKFKLLNCYKTRDFECSWCINIQLNYCTNIFYRLIDFNLQSKYTQTGISTSYLAIFLSKIDIERIQKRFKHAFSRLPFINSLILLRYIWSLK